MLATFFFHGLCCSKLSTLRVKDLRTRRGVCIHSLQATAATNALDHEEDIAKVQEGLRHLNISTTRLYDRRRTKPANSSTFKVSYLKCHKVA